MTCTNRIIYWDNIILFNAFQPPNLDPLKCGKTVYTDELYTCRPGHIAAGRSLHPGSHHRCLNKYLHTNDLHNTEVLPNRWTVIGEYFNGRVGVSLCPCTFSVLKDRISDSMNSGRLSSVSSRTIETSRAQPCPMCLDIYMDRQ